MQALHIELRFVLELHKPHGRPCSCFGNGFGIVIIIFLRLDVGLHVFRRHQPDLVSQIPQHAPKVMRAATSLHRDDAAGQFRRKLISVIFIRTNCSDLGWFNVRSKGRHQIERRLFIMALDRLLPALVRRSSPHQNFAL